MVVVFDSLQPMDQSPPYSSVHGILKARILKSVAILQGIYPTQGLNLGLTHCREILYRLGHRGSLKTKAFLFGPPPLILAPAQHWPPLPPAQFPRVLGVLMGTACVTTSAPV